MADAKISALNSLTKATIATGDLIPVVDISTSETKKITAQELLQPIDSLFRIAGSSDNTKLVAFEVDGLTTATTRTITIPDATTTMVGTDTTQTLTNKTLTAPVINVGSDATGDMYYRSAGGLFTRLAAGSNGDTIIYQSGIPTVTANPAVSSASTTVSGKSELATLAETLARTTTGGTGDNLVVTPGNLTTVLTYDYVADTGSSTAYAIAPTPAITAYVTGQEFRFKAANANTIATPTLAVSGLPTKTIVKNDLTALALGDIKANSEVVVRYNGTSMVMISPVAVPVPTLVVSTQNTSLTANTSEQTVATYTIPAGQLGARHGVRIKCKLQHLAHANGDDVTIKFKFGGTTFTTETLAGAGVDTTTDIGVYEVLILNNTTSAQKYSIQRHEMSGATTFETFGLNSGTIAESTTGTVVVAVTSQTAADGTNAVMVNECTIEYVYAI